MRAEVVRERPARTKGHRQRDACLQRFRDAGLVAVVSTNGSDPEADIQIVKGPQPGDVLEAWVTARGEARLPKAIVTEAPTSRLKPKRAAARKAR